jgi:hypothetical protein
MTDKAQKSMDSQHKQLALQSKRRRIILRKMLWDYMTLTRSGRSPFEDFHTQELYHVLDDLHRGDMKCFAGVLFRETLKGLAAERRPYVQRLPGDVWRIFRSPRSPSGSPKRPSLADRLDAFEARLTAFEARLSAEEAAARCWRAASLLP